MNDKYILYCSAIGTPKYLNDHDKFIREKTIEYLVNRDKVEKKILKHIQRLKNETKRLQDYQTERNEKYYNIIADDYRRWKRTTDPNSTN